jgi:hypothetical protein
MVVVCAFGPTEVQIATRGALVSILATLLLGFLEQEHQRYQRQTELLRQLSVPVALADDSDLFEVYEGIRDTLNLLADVGIYGTRALGIQELDERSRTVRFVLQFASEQIRLARERWQRLQLFATPYRHLLDQLPDDR